ncbi:MAG: phenylalanine--tRNA ligase subunit alpha [Polyangiaceae bacterium]
MEAGAATLFDSIATEQDLRNKKAEYLGKAGPLTQVLRQMGKLPAESKKEIGSLANNAKAAIEGAFEKRLADIAASARKKDLEAPPFDLTLPARSPSPLGHKHPLSIVREEIVDIFVSLGFQIHDGPEIELEENNFTKLGFPPDHPATDMQDSFWTTNGLVLRTHTSNVQVRAMTTHKPPMAFVAPGTVFRRDDDATHSPMFHQIEAFMIDKNVSLAHLKGVLGEFAERFYGPNTPVRLRPSYFPFVEPGAEVDVACVFCKQSDGTRKGCSVCKFTGWIEILGCGMIHPVVFEHCGIDPEEWTGFALGMGVERVAMLRYDLPDLRLFFENDPRFLAQF